MQAQVYTMPTQICNKISLMHYCAVLYTSYTSYIHLTYTLKDMTELINKNKKLDKENMKLRKIKTTMRRKIARLSSKLQKAKESGFHSRRGPSHKSPSDYTKRHLRRLRQQRREKCNDSLAWLEAEGYTATELTITNEQTGNAETIKFDMQEILRGEEQEELDKLDMAIYIKDKHSISGNAYHELAQLFKEMPRHYKIKDRIKELNKAWNIKPTPDGTCGVQQSLEEHLNTRLQYMVRTIYHIIHVVPTACKSTTGKYVILNVNLISLGAVTGKAFN